MNLSLKVTPRLSTKLLPHYLKNNYLEGQAFQIVKELTDMSQIWERLKQSFGNVTSLLSKKLSDLERGDALCRIKDDQKFVFVCYHIQKLHGRTDQIG